MGRVDSLGPLVEEEEVVAMSKSRSRSLWAKEAGEARGKG